MPFAGFGPNALPFLTALAFHQTREWFEANKATYESDLKTPMGDLVEDLSAAFAKAARATSEASATPAGVAGGGAETVSPAGDELSFFSSLAAFVSGWSLVAGKGSRDRVSGRCGLPVASTETGFFSSSKPKI